MDRKKYLIEILNRLDIDDRIKIRIRTELDTLNENQIEKIIIALEKAARRLKKIQFCQPDEVMDEIMDEKIESKKMEMHQKMKKLSEDEKGEKNKEEKVLKNLLHEIDNVSPSPLKN